MLDTRQIEDYALIGDLQTSALVSRAGSIDWCCFPRFDSGACFATLLGEPRHGRWLLAPVGLSRSMRRYRHDTLILESIYETDDGRIRALDFMPPRGVAPDIVRIVEGLDGEVRMRSELAIRFDYGQIVPWVRRVDHARVAIAGPDALCLRTPVEVHGEGMTTVSEFVLTPGERIPFVLTWFPSHEELPAAIDPELALSDAEEFWLGAASRCTHVGDYHEEIHGSLLLLKALTYAPTGGIVAAPTTSLPEWIGGVRNWDYRFCWLRDATLTLLAFMNAGYYEEAAAWREWLLRAVAGRPEQAQIMYGIAGERRLVEWEVPWLPGFRNSGPVRIGNSAHSQLQLDVYGEVMDALHQARRGGIGQSDEGWAVQIAFLKHLESAWTEPDESIWEVRSGRRHFTYSKVMAWVAFDRAIKSAEEYRLDGPIDRWRELRKFIHADVCRKGFDPQQGSFVQSYASNELDASLLLLPMVGFLPPEDPRVIGTIEAIESRLMVDGFVRRYDTSLSDDGLPPGEGVFLACS